MIRFGWVLAWGILGAASPLAAQSTLQRFDLQLEQIQRSRAAEVDQTVPADRRALFDYGGYVTFNYLSSDDPVHDNHGLKQYDLVGYARLAVDEFQDFYVRGRISWRNFNPGDSFDQEGNHVNAGFDLAFYRLDLVHSGSGNGRSSAAGASGPGDHVVFMGGRQLAYWVNGLTLSRTVDGVSLDWTHGVLDARMLAGVTPVDSADFDPSRPSFDDHTMRGFYGGMLSVNAGLVQPFVYGLIQRDYNHGDTLDTPLRPEPILTHFNYNSYYLGAGATGTAGDHLTYGLELVYEGGRGLSNSFQVAGGVPTPIVQSEDSIAAAAADFRLDYLFNDLARTRLGGEVVYGSGDGDRLNTSATLGGNRRGTLDTAFNGFGLINTGLAFGAPVSNLLVVRAGLSSFPLTRWPFFHELQLGTDLFLLMKADPSAPIDRPTGEGRLLGFEPDIFLNWQIRSDVTVAIRYGAFLPHTPVLSDGRAQQFFYAGVTFAF